ncbi:ICP22 family protein [Streptomyces tauricus]|uniref:hypothetical protein n=1 Tax=Streptomyces tauricus TaxID=68274 RepID=UPI002242DE73|nr:hypothetical protein [Streptomyces tauricus]MCW8100858.1 hypothetical protein [Streptomyces tauricus]
MSGHDERARHDEHGRHGDDDEHEQHAGNGTVKHGPSENSGPEESGPTDTEGRPSDRSPGDPTNEPITSGDAGDSVEPVEPVDPDGSDEAPGTSPAEAEVADGTPETASDDAPTKISPLSPRSSKDSAGDSGDAGTESTSTESAGTEPVSAGESGAGIPGLGLGLGAGSGTGGGSGPDMFGSDELALRRLLHQAVEEIEPTDGTLDHLRRAVPARRARKRQALVGMAAAALFIGTAVPALVHVSNSTGSNADPSMAGNTSATQGGANEGKESSSGSGSGSSAGSSKGSDKDDKKDKPGKGKGGGGTAGTPPTTSTAVAPTCTPTQLIAAAGGGAPDATGAVYGTFTVTNVSTASCTVVGDGSVAPTAVGATDQSQLMTALHVAGDPAAGLPDPSTYATSLVLPPGGTYNVKFAWVPSSTCPTSGGNGGTGGGEPTPDPTPTEDPTGASGGTVSEGATGEEPQLMRADGTVDGSVSVSYTAEGGAPAAATTVSNACAGTVYRTGVLAGS